jgi:hypothetical protein
MAKYCDEIFGELLLKEPLKDVHLLPGVPLPSPNQLKGKKGFRVLNKLKSCDPPFKLSTLRGYLMRGDDSSCGAV